MSVKYLTKRPVAFRVSDFAGGWVLTDNEYWAQVVHDKTGASIQGLYTRDGTPVEIDRNALLSMMQVFIDLKYVARADDRQKAMGLAYIEAEREDLVKEITDFFLRTFQIVSN